VVVAAVGGADGRAFVFHQRFIDTRAMHITAQDSAGAAVFGD
jgi:hypothetical protein